MRGAADLNLDISFFSPFSLSLTSLEKDRLDEGKGSAEGEDGVRLSLRFPTGPCFSASDEENNYCNDTSNDAVIRMQRHVSPNATICSLCSAFSQVLLQWDKRSQTDVLSIFFDLKQHYSLDHNNRDQVMTKTKV